MSYLRLALVFVSALHVHASNEVCSDEDLCTQAAQTNGASLLSIKRTVAKTSAVQQVQQVQQQSTDLAAALPAAARATPEEQTTTKALLESFAICGQCNSLKRFGEANDGGYLMCMDGLQPGSTRAAYSLGVEHHDQWSADVISNLGLSVNQFDCTVASSECTACTFFKKCVVSADGAHPLPGHEDEGWSLQQVLAETNQTDAPDGSLLMKMDIESSEWPIYATESPAALKKFGELIVEFHGLEQEVNHPQYYQAMQHILAAGFKVAHLHGNNYAGMYQQSFGNIPNVVEVTFVHGAAREGGCDKTQIYDVTLDAPNNPSAPEMQMAHLR